MTEVYTDELFGLIDLEEFVKSEVESKGIVVIDEIDKLVRAVSDRDLIDSDFSLTAQAQPRQAMRVYSMTCFQSLTEQLYLLMLVRNPSA